MAAACTQLTQRRTGEDDADRQSHLHRACSAELRGLRLAGANCGISHNRLHIVLRTSVTSPQTPNQCPRIAAEHRLPRDRCVVSSLSCTMSLEWRQCSVLTSLRANARTGGRSPHHLHAVSITPAHERVAVPWDKSQGPQGGIGGMVGLHHSGAFVSSRSPRVRLTGKVTPCHHVMTDSITRILVTKCTLWIRWTPPPIHPCMRCRPMPGRPRSKHTVTLRRVSSSATFK